MDSKSQGTYRIGGGDCIKIGAGSYNHSRFGNIDIDVTSSTSFVEKSGNAEWHFNGNSWVATVKKDIPCVAAKGSVFEFTRTDAAADEEKKRKDAETAGKIVAACFGIGL